MHFLGTVKFSRLAVFKTFTFLFGQVDRIVTQQKAAVSGEFTSRNLFVLQISVKAAAASDIITTTVEKLEAGRGCGPETRHCIASKRSNHLAEYTISQI